MISVITPTHDAQHLIEAWRSLQAQTYADWEWVLVPNGDATISDEILQGSQVRICPHDPAHIGALKRYACEQARGEYVVELDHDDLLTPDALTQAAQALDAGADFAYSNHAEFIDGTWQPYTYDASYGWEYRPFSYNGHDCTEIVSFAPTGHSLSLVYYAPDHLRAWRAAAYWDVGGHDASMAICDDHDLCIRFYLAKRVTWIDRCLYLYRRHAAQTFVQTQTNALIQTTTRQLQARYIYRLADRWANLHGLAKVDLGAAHGKPAGFVGVDSRVWPGVDHVCDVSKGLPFDDHSVGIIRAVDFLEHVPDKVALMNEIWRVLCDGGWMLSRTPSTDGRGAFQDPTHVSFWNENSFWYYTNRDYARYVPEIRSRFQAVRLATDYPSDWHKANKIPYVYADLSAVKTWRRRPGRILI